MPVADAKHAEHIVAAAIEINEFMLNRRAQIKDKTFELRIGIHSGSVVAGIVGVKKFAYDIWGDTVNTAARMEEHGGKGRINISQVTYELVKEKFDCVYRGEIEAKNKGVMKMYFVIVVML
jgi:class 3 adenylate cyclase